MTAPLEGLRVVDFSRVLAGPLCAKTLRDLGAHVVKVEPPGGDLARVAVPHIGNMGLYFSQQNAGKRNLSLDLNWDEARTIATELCRHADIIIENFRPGTLKRFGLSYEDVRTDNPRVVYVSITGYGQTTSWRSRPAFAPTVHGETGHTDIVARHYGEAMTSIMNDACSHADVYTGLHGVIAVLAALEARHRTGVGQHVDVAMAATMLAVNERAGALLSGIDTIGEPIALSANESHIFDLPGDRRLTIAGSPIYSPMFQRYCAMMRRTDLLVDPRFATAHLRRANLAALLAEVRSWILTFEDIDQLQSQVSEAGLAVGEVRTLAEFAESEWVKEWNAIVEVDDRHGGTTPMPGYPWLFSNSTLPLPGLPPFQGEHNEEVCAEIGLSQEKIDDLKERHILLSRRTITGDFD